MPSNDRKMQPWSVLWPPPMPEAAWNELYMKRSRYGQPGIIPTDFTKGPPPDPHSEDSYASKWLKLVWMETFNAYATFVHEEKQLESVRTFQRRAKLQVQVGGWVDYKRLYRVTITGTDPNKKFYIPDGMTQPEFLHAMLKLPQGSGWVYVEQVEMDDDQKPATSRSPLASIEAYAKVYTEGLRKMPDSEIELLGWQHCIVFDDFAACRGRFQALQAYSHAVDPIIRDILEGRRSLYSASVEDHIARSGGLLLPVSSSLRTKLNSRQQEILRALRAPVDFVQGPPGTGKSTFIVELLQVCCHVHICPNECLPRL